MNYKELLDSLIKNGATFIAQRYDTELKCWYCDLNFQTKSHAFLYDVNGLVLVKMRYGDECYMEDFREVLFLFRDLYESKGFGNYLWLELCELNGIKIKQR